MTKVSILLDYLGTNVTYVTLSGSNYSAGEKQLLALCRALVKNSRIIVLVSPSSHVPRAGV